MQQARARYVMLAVWPIRYRMGGIRDSNQLQGRGRRCEQARMAATCMQRRSDGWCTAHAPSAATNQEGKRGWVVNARSVRGNSWYEWGFKHRAPRHVAGRGGSWAAGSHCRRQRRASLRPHQCAQIGSAGTVAAQQRPAALRCLQLRITLSRRAQQCAGRVPGR